MVRKRDYEGLNAKGSSISERKEVAETRIIAVTEWLKNLNNDPNRTVKEPNKPIGQIMDDFIKLKAKTVRKKSLTHYTQGQRVFNEYGYSYLKPEQFTPVLAQGFSDWLITTKGYAPKSHNNHISYIAGIFNMMVDREMIDRNPFRKVKKLILGSGRVLYYKPAQKEKIKEYLKRNNHPLYLYVQFIFYCFIRPSELMQIQVKHIDFENKTVMIPGYASKNRKDGVIPIHEDLFKLVKSKYSNLDAELFLFGKGLIPSPVSVHRNRASQSHKLMLKDIGIPPEHHLYDWKHTGARLFILSGNKPFDLMMYMRHSDFDMTMHYLRSLGISTISKPDPKAWKF
jgi:integrase